ncbi:MAG: SRPBCC family protein [Bacteroidota bacterium]
MTRIESNKVSIHKSSSEALAFLQKMENIALLLPDQVENFTSDATTCRFEIKGMGPMGLKLGEITSDKITFLKNEKAPFDFSLFATVNEITPNFTEVQLVFEADLNPIFKMMAEKPLNNFVNHLTQKFQSIMNG